MSLVFIGTAPAQTSYTWSGTSGSWSGTGNWSPTGAPGSVDTANLSNIDGTVAKTITYDAGASGTIGTLNFFNNAAVSPNFTVTLALARSLDIATAANFYMISGTGATVINLGANNLTVDSGATFTMGSTTATNLSNFATFSGTGGLMVNGTFTAVSNLSANTWVPTVGVATTFGNGSTVNIDSEGTSVTRLLFSGDFTTTGTVSINALGANKNNSSLYLTGVNNTIGAGTTFTGFTQGATFGALVFDATSAITQNISLGVFTSFGLRNTATGTLATPVTSIEKVSSTATSGATSNATGTIFWTNSSAYSTSILQLASNLNVMQSGALSSSPNTSSIGSSLAVDLNGFALDLSNSGSSSRFAIGTTFANGSMAFIKNSGASSITGGQGILRALGFNLAAGDDAVGAGVILQATASGITSDLGVLDAGSLSGVAATGLVPAIAATLIDPTSTFYFTGAGTGDLQSTNNRAIGQLVVGTAAGSASTLGLLSNIVAQGATTVNSGGTLDLAGKTYSTTGVSGSGIVKNSSAATTSTTLTINPAGVSTFSGSLINTNPANSLSVVVGTGTGTQVFSGAVSYAGTTTVNGGTLLITGTYSGGAVTVNGGRFGGAGGSISNNITVNAGGGLSISGGGTVTAGTLTIAGSGSSLDLSAALNDSGELAFVLGSDGGTSDKVFLSSTSGLLKLGTGLLSLSDFGFTTGATFGAGTYTLFDTNQAAGITGSLAASDLTGTLDGFTTALSLSTDGSGHADVVLTVTAAPEPSSLALTGIGGALLLVVALRRRRTLISHGSCLLRVTP